MNPNSNLAGYPEITFSAANFFGPTPPAQANGGPTLLAQGRNSVAKPTVNIHTIIVVGVLVIGGYLVWHFTYEK